jgi:hypothetical protein
MQGDSQDMASLTQPEQHASNEWSRGKIEGTVNFFLDEAL